MTRQQRKPALGNGIDFGACWNYTTIQKHECIKLIKMSHSYAQVFIEHNAGSKNRLNLAVTLQVEKDISAKPADLVVDLHGLRIQQEHMPVLCVCVNSGHHLDD